MALTQNQINSLMDMVITTEPDQTDCDGCLGQLAEFADIHLSTKEVPEAMKVIQRHLEQCLCCKDEFNALLKGLEAIEMD